jgi:hypothetical protein
MTNNLLSPHQHPQTIGLELPSWWTPFMCQRIAHPAPWRQSFLLSDLTVEISPSGSSLVSFIPMDPLSGSHDSVYHFLW